MEQHDLDNLILWKKQQFFRLTDTANLTRELAQALDRKDQASVQIVLSMRQEPLQQAEELEKRIQNYLLTLPEENAIRFQALLKGASPVSPKEKELCDQVARNQRILKEITDLDRLLSLRLGGKKSFYHLIHRA